MKRSKSIPLMLIGTLALAACGPQHEEVTYRQHGYDSKQQCVQDWGNEQQCQSRSGGGYVGPRYMWNHGAGHPVVINQDGSTQQLSNTYLSRPGTASAASSAVTGTVSAPANSQIASAGRASGSVISRGGFGSSARAASVGG